MSSRAHPFTSLIPDTLACIFSYHIQFIPHQINHYSPLDIAFLSNFVLSWHFDESVDIEAFMRQRRGNMPLYFLDASYNRHLNNSTFQYFQGIHELHIDRVEEGYTMEMPDTGVKLQYRESQFDDKAFESLQGIHTLSMRCCSHITDEAFVHLKGIDTLCIDHCHSLSDAAFVHIHGVKCLSMIGCSQLQISDCAFEYLRGIQQLDLTDLTQDTITDRAFQNLQGVKKLRIVRSWSTQSDVLPRVTSAALQYLQGARKLILNGLSWVDDEHAVNFLGVECLSLIGCPHITNRSLNFFVRTKILSIFGTGIRIHSREQLEHAATCLRNVEALRVGPCWSEHQKSMMAALTKYIERRGGDVWLG